MLHPLVLIKMTKKRKKTTCTTSSRRREYTASSSSQGNRHQQPPVSSNKDYVHSEHSDTPPPSPPANQQHVNIFFPKPLTIKKLHRAQEKDFRFIFESKFGNLFRERLITKGWDCLLGSSNTFVNLSYVTHFRNNLIGQTASTLRYVWKENNRRHCRSITPKFLSEFTGIPMTTSEPNWSFFEDMEKPLTKELAESVAPYHTSAHFDVEAQSLRVRGMQANTMAVTKWACQNIFGFTSSDKIHGKVAWFVDCLIKDSFPPNFDIHVLLVATLRSHLAGSEPLPALTSAIVASARHLDHVSDVPKISALRPTKLLKSDISGLFTGEVYTTSHPLRPTVHIGGDGGNVKDFFRVKKSGHTIGDGDSGGDEDNHNHDDDADDEGTDVVPKDDVLLLKDVAFRTVTPHPPTTEPSSSTPPDTTPEPSSSVLSYDAYLTLGYVCQIPQQDQLRCIWDQNAMMLQNFHHMFSHMKIKLPQYRGFSGPGFSFTSGTTTDMSSGHADIDTGGLGGSQ